jgi:FHS family Na+ dependent glucose MFS transporter 1
MESTINDGSEDVVVTTIVTRKLKYILTFAVYFCYFTYGLGFSIIGPTLLDIAELVRSSFHEVSFGVVSRSASYCAGALFCGWAFNKVNRQLGFVVSLLIAGASLLCIPFVRELYFFILAQAVFGFAIAGLDVAGNAWILEIWQEGANPYMQGLHFSYAIGMTVAPLIAEPFLSPEIRRANSTIISVDNGTTAEFFNLTNATSVSDIINSESQIAIPFAICALSLSLSAVLLFILYFTSPYTETLRTASQAKVTVSGRQMMEKDEEQSNLIPMETPKDYFYKIIILGSLLICFYTGIELNTFTFLPDFVIYSDLRLTKSTGAYMLSVLSATFAACRGISIIVATRVKTSDMLYTNMLMIGIGNAILLCYGNSSEKWTWVGFMVVGIGHSCVFPGVYAFLEERINVTNSVCGCFMFASSIATTTNPILIGYFVETMPMIFVYINVVSLVICLIIFIGLHSTDSSLRKGQESTVMS